MEEFVLTIIRTAAGLAVVLDNYLRKDVDMLVVFGVGFQG